MKKRNYIDDMVDIFGYDYVIGFCLCSEYDMNQMADRETDSDKIDMFRRKARMFSRKSEELMRERIANGL